MEYFPLPSPRDRQIVSLNFVQQRIQEGFTDIVVAAPTGLGKSAIGVAISYWLAQQPPTDEGQAKGAYYVVTQKLLQNQLANDARRYKAGCNDGQLIKTADEYPCEHYDNCGVGGRAQRVCSNRATGSCAYRIQKNLFLSATLGITNYAYLFAERTYAGALINRQALVLDECHTVEEEIIRFVDGSVTTEDVKRWTSLDEVPKISTLSQYAVWLDKAYLPQAREMLETLLELTDAESDAEKGKELTDLDKHVCKLNRAIKLINTEPSNWVYWQDRDEETGALSCIARPISGAPFADELIHSVAPIRIYLSAYPGIKDVFCRNLNLNPKKVAWATLASSFPIKNRQIFGIKVGSMGLQSKQATTPVLLSTIGKIINKHSDRGLIHCGSYDLGQKIVDYLNGSKHGSRVIFPKNADEREASFAKHASTPGSILISPSMTEGFDFAGDLARWQILAKCPWPFLGDKQILAKKERDPEWYLMKTVMTMIQACGRICRSEDDRGTSYLLDSDFENLWKRAEYMMPKWFKEAVTWVN